MAGMGFKTYITQLSNVKNIKSHKKMDSNAPKAYPYGLSDAPEMEEDEENTVSTDVDNGQNNEIEFKDANNVEPTETTDKKPENLNRQGLIRVVKNAHLIYKRKDKTGTFEELWLYHIKENMKTDYVTRNAILAGTDIEKNHTTSEDGLQSYELWSIGNIQFLHLTGLPS